MFLLAGTVNAFAGTNSHELPTKKSVSTKAVKVFNFKKADPDNKKLSCTVTATWTVDNVTNTMTVTSSCDCTQQQACNAAYALISLVIPG